MYARLPEDQRAFIKENGIFFPATTTFRFHMDYLIPYLKMLLIGDQPKVELDGRPIQVIELLRGALASLLNQFVSPALALQQGKETKEVQSRLRRIVFTLPNSFLQYHCDMFKKCLPSNGLHPNPRYVRFISESDAVAYYFLYTSVYAARLSGYGKDGKFTLLVYDCGAGTLDLSLREVDCTGAKPTSTLIRMLSIEGAGNNLDECIAHALGRKLETIDEGLRDDEEFDFRINYDPLARYDDTSGVRRGVWRSGLQDLKESLIQTKKRIWRASEDGRLSEDFDIQVAVPMSGSKRGLCDLTAPNTKDSNARLRALGVVLPPNLRGKLAPGVQGGSTEVRINLKLSELEDSLENSLDETKGRRSFYDEHINLPLEAILYENDGTYVQPDVVLVTGRTALYPGISQRLQKWFSERGSAPKFESFSDNAELMKSVVVNGALQWADEDPPEFDANAIYGYYGILAKVGASWEWHCLCDHNTLGSTTEVVVDNRPAGSCNTDHLSEILFVYSTIDPKRLLPLYETAVRDKPGRGQGPVAELRQFFKLRGSASVAQLKGFAKKNRTTKAEFLVTYARHGGILQVAAKVRVGDDAVQLIPDSTLKDLRRHDPWPYRLWTTDRRIFEEGAPPEVAEEPSEVSMASSATPNTGDES